MKPITVIINTETGKVRSVEQFVMDCSDVCIVGEIDGDAQESRMGPGNPNEGKKEMESLQISSVINLDTVLMNHKHRLVALEKTSEINNRAGEQIIELCGRVIELERRANDVAVHGNDILHRLVALEHAKDSVNLKGSKEYLFGEIDKIVKELDYQKKRFDYHVYSPDHKSGTAQGFDAEPVVKRGRGRPRKVLSPTKSDRISQAARDLDKHISHILQNAKKPKKA
jgi:hypothetical protein